jgi:hypothetical protein
VGFICSEHRNLTALRRFRSSCMVAMMDQGQDANIDTSNTMKRERITEAARALNVFINMRCKHHELQRPGSKILFVKPTNKTEVLNEFLRDE